MQILVLLIFLIAWLFIFWLGAIAFEITGMERSKARFQSLSALSGTGFTTSEAESIVNHPRCRRIAAWLIFIGNTGIIVFILILILYLRNGLIAPTLAHIIIALLPLLVITLSMRFGIVNKLSSVIVRSLQKKRAASRLIMDELLLKTGEYGIVRLSVNWRENMLRLKLKDYDFYSKEFSILAIERDGNILPFPEENELLLEGDRLLCYGKLTELPVSDF